MGDLPYILRCLLPRMALLALQTGCVSSCIVLLFVITTWLTCVHCSQESLVLAIGLLPACLESRSLHVQVYCDRTFRVLVNCSLLSNLQCILCCIPYADLVSATVVAYQMVLRMLLLLCLASCLLSACVPAYCVLHSSTCHNPAFHNMTRWKRCCIISCASCSCWRQ